VYLQTFGATLALLYVLILLIDPFDNRFFPSLQLSGSIDTDARTAIVSRGRDQRFDAAIIGNSQMQLLSPARLDSATGLGFVHLTMPGSGPREQLTAWAWFARHHPHPGAIVLGAGPGWCTSDPSPAMYVPFPFWLYSGRPIDYYLNIFSTGSLERSWRRLMLALGLQTPSDPTGYWDYETGTVWNFHPTLPSEASRSAAAIPPGDLALSFPAAGRLAEAIASVPADTAVIIVMPPVFYTDLPSSGSADDVRVAACKQALSKLVAGRRHSAFIDLRADNPLARDPANFMDEIHYRGPVARLIEARIARVLRDGADLASTHPTPPPPCPWAEPRRCSQPSAAP
jgi:hypothetical protein